MDILVVSGCSGSKLFDDAPIGCGVIDSASRADLVKEYPDYVARASEMYTGEEHGYVRCAVENLRKHADVSWQVVSAGYGLLDEDDEIAAYNCTLRDIESVMERAKQAGHDPEELTHDAARRVVARETNMVEDLGEAFDDGYDLVFIAISGPYYAAVSEALENIPAETTVIAFASTGSKKYLEDAYWAPATGEVRARLGSNNFRLRGELLEIASENSNRSDLTELVQHPENIGQAVPAIRLF
jgi:hypothetical protein